MKILVCFANLNAESLGFLRPLTHQHKSMSVLTSGYTKQLHQYFGYQEVMGFSLHPILSGLKYGFHRSLGFPGWVGFPLPSCVNGSGKAPACLVGYTSDHPKHKNKTKTSPLPMQLPQKGRGKCRGTCLTWMDMTSDFLEVINGEQQ